MATCSEYGLTSSQLGDLDIDEVVEAIKTLNASKLITKPERDRIAGRLAKKIVEAVSA